MLAKLQALAQSALAQVKAMSKAALIVGAAAGYICHPIIKIAVDAICLAAKAALAIIHVI